MRRYREAVKADVRRRMGLPHRQSVAQISAELGIHIVTLYNWRKAWRLQGEAVPASEKDPEGWNAADKFTVVLETAGLNATELSAYCRERGLYPEQVEHWQLEGRRMFSAESMAEIPALEDLTAQACLQEARTRMPGGWRRRDQQRFRRSQDQKGIQANDLTSQSSRLSVKERGAHPPRE
jgi:transposase